MRCYIFFYCVVALLSNRPANAQPRPQSLENLEAYRAALRTGLVEWSVANYRPDMGDQRGVPRYLTSKFADDSVMAIDRGDENGVVMRDENGRVSGKPCVTPRFRFQTKEGMWEKMDGELQPLSDALLLIGARGISDPRSLGVAVSPDASDIHETLWLDSNPAPAACRYEESREGDLHVVRIIRTDATAIYWIDPRRGWSPLKVRYEYPEFGGWVEARSMLKEMDGVWMPELIQYYDSSYEDGKTPAEIVRVHNATFNRPEHPQRLTLEDIGVDVGTYVEVHKPNEKAMLARWDGEQVIGANEFTNRGLKEGPIFRREVARHKQNRAEKALASLSKIAIEDLDPVSLRKSVSKDPKQCESLWEAYTRKFIEKYKLNDDQTQKALAILKDCQDRGKAHLDGHRDEFAKYDELLKKTPQGENPDLQAMRDKLIKPLDDIFEQRLVPRLDKLPTRAQRKAAGIGNPNKPDADPKP